MSETKSFASDSKTFAQRLQDSWYQPASKRFYYLQPLSWLFGLISRVRRKAYELELFYTWKASVPVIVVGNINVGGSGKTPIVIALIEKLRAAGYRSGVISRGYGGKAQSYPLAVTENTSPEISGDEPALIAQRCHVPVVVDPDRVTAARFLLSSFDCDVIISDDGLQHYALQRDIEIVVIDGVRGIGNGELLPTGPLREPVSRLKSVFAVLVNGSNALDILSPCIENFSLKPEDFVQLSIGNRESDSPTPSSQDSHFFVGKKIVAVAGIGNPDRFFTSLEAQGLVFERLAFPDHYAYSANDIKSIQADIILMTEKDAVKCRSFNDDRIWYQPVAAQLPDSFYDALQRQLSQISTVS